MKTSTPSDPPSLDLPTRLYRGERPFRSLLALYRHDLDKLGLSLLFYVIKHSPEWIKPIVVANVIDIISNPGTRSLSSCLILSAKGDRTEDLKYYQSSTYNLSTAMTSIQSPTTLTLAEFLQLPETKPASEYIDGRIYQKPMPKGKHSAIQTFLAPAINQISIPKKLARAFTELRCTFEGRSLVPDITVFAWQRIPLDADGEIENTFEIAPDWTIEILSPDQSPTRVINNILFCLNHGTELGWLIDSQERMIMTLKPGQQPEIKQEEENLPVLTLLGDWQLSGQEVFSYLSLN